MATKALFDSVKIGDLVLRNKILMAPLTRCRANANHDPTPLMAEYYGQRASAGLIICEATMVAAGNSAFGAREPGIYSERQVAGWKSVVDAVHAKGGLIVLQLWHGGRACHSLLNKGNQPVSASAIAISNDQIYTPEGKVDYEVPRALEDYEIPVVIDQFRRAAVNAKRAGFDAVEVHGANGYLLDQFLRSNSNKRPANSPYGGPLEKRAKLLLDVVDAVVAVYGAGRVGVRISPLNSYNDMKDEDPVAMTSYVAAKLDERKIAYLHVMRGDFFQAQQGDVLGAARAGFKGTLIGNMGYTPEEAAKAIESGAVNAVAFGSSFISNPTLVEKIKNGEPLAKPDSSTFYTNDAKGYTDYP